MGEREGPRGTMLCPVVAGDAAMTSSGDVFYGLKSSLLTSL